MVLKKKSFVYSYPWEIMIDKWSHCLLLDLEEEWVKGEASTSTYDVESQLKCKETHRLWFL